MILPYYLSLFLSNIVKKNSPIYAIIGNPPYQVMDGGGSGTGAIAVYNHFVDIARSITPNYISMIMPARWYTGGKGLDAFRADMLADRRIRKMTDYPNPKECFPNTNISGGICYFLWDRRYEGLCAFENVIEGERNKMMRRLDEHDIFIRYNTSLSIIKKVLSSQGFSSLSSLVSTRNPFGLPSAVRGTDTPTDETVLKVYSSGGVGWIKEDEVGASIPLIDRHKVFMGKVLSGHLGETDEQGRVKVIATVQRAEPMSVCTDSYLLIGNFDTEQEAENLSIYLRTKTLRYLLLQALASMNISRSNFRFVPLLDFKQTWTDEELYRRFGFDEEEIQIIEKTIKSM
ncbi:Eco57I restriction-modification methylase domain-containing protein [Porphyromonas loveana]|uniref:Eco57I restriction-modification methylase domain-containing protein n=1 Tax=Porphyromonas loveana TaxID=1884669 RepID=UPI000E30E922|nr:Eco57I restriction-modification methylase domain-containing protein [Porphyromonas loveana]